LLDCYVRRMELRTILQQYGSKWMEHFNNRAQDMHENQCTGG